MNKYRQQSKQFRWVRAAEIQFQRIIIHYLSFSVACVVRYFFLSRLLLYFECNCRNRNWIINRIIKSSTNLMVNFLFSDLFVNLFYKKVFGYSLRFARKENKNKQSQNRFELWNERRIYVTSYAVICCISMHQIKLTESEKCKC